MLTPEVVDDAPVAARVGVGRRRLEQHRGRAVGERPVDDVAVPGDPAHVGGAEEDVARVVVEHHLVGVGGVDEVAARGVHEALGLAGAARGVEDEERVLGAHPLVGAGRALLAALLVEPEVAPRRSSGPRGRCGARRARSRPSTCPRPRGPRSS